MTDKEKKSYINTTVKNDLLTSIKVLAAQKGLRMNALLEEAIQDLLNKYGEGKKK